MQSKGLVVYNSRNISTYYINIGSAILNRSHIFYIFNKYKRETQMKDMLNEPKFNTWYYQQRIA